METLGTDAALQAVRGEPIDYVLIFGYFVAIMGFGTLFGKFTRTTRDFFFGGQRFPWWLIAMSLLATIVGSYSFVKYSRVAYEHGFSSTMTYMNDWFYMPVYLFIWIPVIYFSRVVSIPEYFTRRFDARVGLVAVCYVVLYMVGYIGINFYTLGKAVHAMLGWPVFTASFVVAAIACVYVTAGGQTAVIMTDLVQGFLLILAGFVLFGIGLNALGGFAAFWNALPPDHRTAFAPFNAPARFNFVGVFWQDTVVQGVAAWFLNQGIIMRVLSAKSERDGRYAILATVLLLQPLAAVVVANAGWVGSAMVSAGLLPASMKPNDAFVDVAYRLCLPGVFGLIMAALTSALMSTADTLINATSAVAVNDIWKSYVRPHAPDRHYLAVARWVSVIATVLGLLLVLVYQQFHSIYQAHGFFTAAIGPPMVVAALLGLLWKRFTPRAALWTLLGGAVAMGVSIAWPDVVRPFAHGTPAEGRFGVTYSYMRGLYGLAVSGAIGVSVTWFSRPRPEEELRGLVWGTVREAKRAFKGGEPNETPSRPVMARSAEGPERFLPCRLPDGSELARPLVPISRDLLDELRARPGDLVYLDNPKRRYVSLFSTHAVAGEPPGEAGQVRLPPALLETLRVRPGERVRIEKIL